MRTLLLILTAFIITACGPKFIYKPNGVPVISCSDLNNRKAALSNSVAAKCISRNILLLQEIYASELKGNEKLEQSFEVPICVSPDGTAKVRAETAPPKSQLEKLVRSYIELIEFPRSNGNTCFTTPFIFQLPKKEA